MTSRIGVTEEFNNKCNKRGTHISDLKSGQDPGSKKYRNPNPEHWEESWIFL
jgi:hypothetical protein